MNKLHGNSTSAVVTRLHDVQGRGPERTGAEGGTPRASAFERGGGRGCARGTGRQHTGYMTVIDARGGRRTGEPRTGRPQGERRALTEAEFTAYVQERRASLYATAYHLTGDRFEAEDLLQSALFSTYRARDRISDKAAVGGYLRRTMTNLHISAWRRRKLNEPRPRNCRRRPAGTVREPAAPQRRAVAVPDRPVSRQRRPDAPRPGGRRQSSHRRRGRTTQL
ncbi:hypothetical protein SFUMM280S_03446 [Streptomyces fumanus]